MGNTRITEIEVGYLSEPEGTVDIGTKWAIKRDKCDRSSVREGFSSSIDLCQLAVSLSH